MKPVTRRAFLSVGAAGATAGALASIPILSESYLAAEALDKAVGKTGDLEQSQIVKLSANENPYGPCPLAREAITRFTPLVSRYGDMAVGQLLERIAKLHDIPREWLVLGNGSSEVLRMAAGAFLKPGKTVVTGDPTYESPARYARVVGAEVKTVPLTDDLRHDVKAMAAAAAAARNTGLVYVCNPNNPTATVNTKDEIASLVAALPAGAVLLVDEAYYHFVDSPTFESALRLVQAGKPVVVSRTFSKIYGLAGLRIGYGIARPEFMEPMRRQMLHINNNVLGLQAALASLEDPDLVPRTRERNARARRIVTDWLDRQRIRYVASHANFLFFHTGKEVSGLIGAMYQKGVAVGRPFPPLTDWMRVTIGTEEEMRRFLNAYQEIHRG